MGARSASNMLVPFMLRSWVGESSLWGASALRRATTLGLLFCKNRPLYVGHYVRHSEGTGRGTVYATFVIPKEPVHSTVHATVYATFVIP